jgi:lycopene beta-cyclase
MTYLQFHLVFILPLILLLAGLAWWDLRRGKLLAGNLGSGNQAALFSVAIHVILAILYTTPWDNYLVYRNVWGYPEGRVLFSIGYVPFEEYLFFIFQTIIAALFLFLLARRGRAIRFELEGGLRTRALGVLVALMGFIVGAVALNNPKGTYMGLILVWAMPVLILQWGFGGDILVKRWRLILPAITLPTLYLWLADRYAIVKDGIWWINPELTTGWHIAGLPIEEMLFFLMPNLFVVFGITLGLHPLAFKRAKHYGQRVGFLKEA